MLHVIFLVTCLFNTISNKLRFKSSLDLENRVVALETVTSQLEDDVITLQSSDEDIEGRLEAVEAAITGRTVSVFLQSYFSKQPQT